MSTSTQEGKLEFDYDDANTEKARGPVELQCLERPYSQKARSQCFFWAQEHSQHRMLQHLQCEEIFSPVAVKIMLPPTTARA